MLVRARDSVSNESTFSKAPSTSMCEDPFEFSEAELTALDRDQMVRLGVISLRSEVMPGSGVPTDTTYVRNEAAFAEFARRDVEDIARIAQPVVSDERYFSCELVNPITVARFVAVDDFDAGDTLRVQGPGKALDVPHPSVPVLYATFRCWIPGTWASRRSSRRENGASAGRADGP